MTLIGSIFLEIGLPNAATWFYLSLLLALALFFKFGQPFSLRNWDLLMLFLLVPPLLYLHESEETKTRYELEAQTDLSAQLWCLAADGSGVPAIGAAAVLGEALVRCAGTPATPIRPGHARALRNLWRAYVWLLIASGYFLFRALIDLALARRSVLAPNLAPGGLIWLVVALFAVLAVKTVLPPTESIPETSSQSLILKKATMVVTQTAENLNETVVRQKNVDMERFVQGALAIGCHLVIVIGLMLIGKIHFQNGPAGIAAALLYLVLPYTGYHVKDVHHVLPAALLIAAIGSYRWPMVSGIWIGLATSLVYFPIFLLPLWIGFYRHRGVGRFITCFCAATAFVIVGAYVWLGGELREDLAAAIRTPDWRAWDPTALPTQEGLWMGVQLPAAYRTPLFIAHLAMVVASAFWPSPKNLGHLIALSAALVLGVQFWYADHGGIYVLWYLPLLLLLFIRPNCADKMPKTLDPEGDWLSRIGRWLRSGVQRSPREPASMPM